MDLNEILGELNDQEVGTSIDIEAKLVLAGSEVKPGDIMSYPEKFSLKKLNEAAYELRAVQGGFKIGFVVTDYWEFTDGYVKTGILNITDAEPKGCAVLVNHFKPTELRFEYLD